MSLIIAMTSFDQLAITPTSTGSRFNVKVVPGASRDAMVGVLGDALKVTTSAAPEKGRANDAVVHILARTLDIPPSAITLTSGPAQPRKQFQITGLKPEEIRRRLSDR